LAVESISFSVVILQGLHRQRWRPVDVLPWRIMGQPHTGHDAVFTRTRQTRPT